MECSRRYNRELGIEKFFIIIIIFVHLIENKLEICIGPRKPLES